MKFIPTFFISICSFCYTICLQAQSTIDYKGLKINKVDKKDRKQGAWIFFNEWGEIAFTSQYVDDSCVSPIIFYDNKDTTFIRFQPKDNVEYFVFYKHKKPYYGSYTKTSDSTHSLEMDDAASTDDSIMAEIKHYLHFSLKPIYYFAQKKMSEFNFKVLYSINFILNKPVYLIVSLSSSGVVNNIEFPKDKNLLPIDEERELSWEFSKMPRWQPYFVKNKTVARKVYIKFGSKLTFMDRDMQ